MGKNDDRIIQKLAGEGLKPLEKGKRVLSENVTFHQETYRSDHNRSVNLYWVEIDRKNCKFALLNSIKRRPLIDIAKEFQQNIGSSILAGINTSIFYLVDKGREPKFSAFNLYVKDGQVLQFPSIDKITLIESNNSISLRYLKAKGEIKIGRLKLNWIGAKKHSRAGQSESPSVIIYGLSDVRFKYCGGSRRKTKKAISGSARVDCLEGRLLLGIDLDKNGNLAIVKKSLNKLNLLDYLYIIETNKLLRDQVTIGDSIADITIDNHSIGRNENAVSLSFGLPEKFSELRPAVSREIVPSIKNILKPLQPSFVKSWSLILFTKSKLIFFLVDSFPFKQSQAGLNLLELHKLVSQKFNFEIAAVCDAGQSSKICLKKTNGNFQVFGNLHYINFTSAKPKWDGIRGRAIPSALIAYQ